MKNNKLRKYVEKYEKSIEEYGNKLDLIIDNINKALFNEKLITVKSKINAQETIVRIIENQMTNSYLIPVFTDLQEYNKLKEEIDFEQEGSTLSPYITDIHEFIEIGLKDPKFEGIIINPSSQNFRIEINSVIEYNSKYLKEQ